MHPTSVLIIYGTTEGQTAKIARRIGYELEARGILADTLDARYAPAALTLAGYDGVIVGASMHVGGFQHSIRTFVRKHHADLERLPNAFFSVSLTAAYPQPEQHARLESHIAHFFEETHWRPNRVASFAGALAYTRYDFVKRHLMQGIARQVGAPVDPTHDVECTNWGDVERFSDEFATALAIVPTAPAMPVATH